VVFPGLTGAWTRVVGLDVDDAGGRVVSVVAAARGRDHASAKGCRQQDDGNKGDGFHGRLHAISGRRSQMNSTAVAANRHRHRVQGVDRRGQRPQTLRLHRTGVHLMTPRIFALLLAITLGAASPLVAAAPPAGKPDAGASPMGMQDDAQQQNQRGQQRPPLESFTEETTRKMADGRVFRHKVEQVVSDSGFSRKEVLTNPDGKTTSRTVTTTFDKSKKTWSRKMEGVGFDGKTWSRSDEGDLPAAPAPAPKTEGRPADRKKGG